MVVKIFGVDPSTEESVIDECNASLTQDIILIQDDEFHFLELTGIIFVKGMKASKKGRHDNLGMLLWVEVEEVRVCLGHGMTRGKVVKVLLDNLKKYFPDAMVEGRVNTKDRSVFTSFSSHPWSPARKPPRAVAA